jgi:hypothetical protein
MECRNIQEKLSAYIDEILSPQEKVTVDEHLKSCGECATALADLKKTVERVRNLESLEPPAWMTQKIMARVRAEAQPRKGLFQRLFFPLHIKLPVGAIATIAIALTTLYVFRTIEPEIKLAKVPTEEAAPQVPEKEQQLTQRDAEAEKIPPMFSPLEKGGEGGLKETKRVSPKPAEQPVPSKKPEPVREVPKAPEPMKQAELSQEQRAAAPSSGKDVSTPSVGALAKEEVKGEAAPAAPKMKVMAEERKESIRVTVHVKDVGSEQKEIERHISELGGRVVKKESYESKDILTVEIDSDKLKEFFKRLKSVGQVKEKDVDLDGTKGVVGLRIEIVKNPHSD